MLATNLRKRRRFNEKKREENTLSTGNWQQSGTKMHRFYLSDLLFSTRGKERIILDIEI